MATARRLTADLVIDGATLSGVVTDEAGRTQPFQGWLELIAVVQTAGRPDDAAGTAAGAQGHDPGPSR